MDPTQGGGGGLYMLRMYYHNNDVFYINRYSPLRKFLISIYEINTLI